MRVIWKISLLNTILWLKFWSISTKKDLVDDQWKERWYLMASSHYLNQYNGVRQNDWETRPPPGNYSTASDTWIQASTNKMLAPDYGWWRSNSCDCDVIMSRLWLWWSWRPHNLQFWKAQCISSSAAWCGRPKLGPKPWETTKCCWISCREKVIIRLVCEVYHSERKGWVGQWLQPLP